MWREPCDRLDSYLLALLEKSERWWTRFSLFWNRTWKFCFSQTADLSKDLWPLHHRSAAVGGRFSRNLELSVTPSGTDECVTIQVKCVCVCVLCAQLWLFMSLWPLLTGWVLDSALAPMGHGSGFAGWFLHRTCAKHQSVCRPARDQPPFSPSEEISCCHGAKSAPRPL